jgi:translation elongation factor EF-4
MHRSQVFYAGRQWVTKFKEFVQRQLFEVVIQAAVGKHIVARETVKPVRKDVTAKLYGGDRTRRMKLLEKQKEGRKKLQGMMFFSNSSRLFLPWKSITNRGLIFFSFLNIAIGRVTIEQTSFQGFLQKQNK